MVRVFSVLWSIWSKAAQERKALQEHTSSQPPCRRPHFNLEGDSSALSGRCASKFWTAQKMHFVVSHSKRHLMGLGALALLSWWDLSTCSSASTPAYTSMELVSSLFAFSSRSWLPRTPVSLGAELGSPAGMTLLERQTDRSGTGLSKSVSDGYTVDMCHLRWLLFSVGCQSAFQNPVNTTPWARLFEQGYLKPLKLTVSHNSKKLKDEKLTYHQLDSKYQ